MRDWKLVEKRVDQGQTTLRIQAQSLARSEDAGELSDQLCKTIEQNQDSVDHVEVDFASTRQISSAGLNSLMILKSKVRRHEVDFVLCNVNSPVRDVFRLTRLERLFEFDQSCATVALT